jgi:hypothetical protein
MSEQFLEQVGRAKTVNQLNAQQIQIYNVMTPREAMMAHRLIADPNWKFPNQTPGSDEELAMTAAARDHMVKVIADMVDTGKQTAEPFERQAVARGVWRFSAPGPRRDKSLLIGFTGNSDRLMMPCPTFLQHFDAARTDIVFLADRSRQAFRNGIEGLAGNFEELIAVLPGLLSISDYRRLAITGTSNGGLPSVLAGLMLRAEMVMSVGGSDPEGERWAALQPTSAADLLRRAGPASPETQVTLVVGTECLPDQLAAETTRRLIDAEIVVVSHPSQPVKHNAVYPLVKLRQFGAFAARYLGV